MRLLFAACWVLLSTSALALDEHSYARYDQVRVTRLYLDLDADFQASALRGFAELTLDWSDPAARSLVLDTRDLTIERVLVRDADGRWRPARHRLGARHPVKGQALTIDTGGQPARVRIHYHSAPQASGLQWLTPAQTLGRQHPFMFSQSQAIHARSWVPLQDTPAVRFPYQARITAPQGLRVVMSADNDPAASGQGGFRFTMPQPIPSYLLAIAVGELAFKPIGPRSGIYAEPGMVEAAAKEYEDTEAMVAATEQLYGPYRWGRYDLLVLPPSFPYGGMENPRLTFLTPTAIAGDKSLVALIAHELAHSWSGNLVTNVGWAHFWLNEGFTTYVENRIVEVVYGAEEAELQRVVEQVELAEELKETPEHLQWLVPKLEGVDPDEVFSGVPYSKGAWLLQTIERGAGRAAFDRFLRGWFDDYAFGSVDTDQFLAYLRKNLLAAHPGAISETELAQWLYAPGVPASARPDRSAKLELIDKLRKRWLAGEIGAEALAASSWSTGQWLHFLNTLPQDLAAERLAELDAAWQLTQARNSEIAFRWYLAGIRAGYAPVKPQLEQFLLSVGRRKFVKPLFEELAKQPADKAWAIEVYTRAKPGYHPVTQAAVDRALGLVAG